MTFDEIKQAQGGVPSVTNNPDGSLKGTMTTPQPDPTAVATPPAAPPPIPGAPQAAPGSPSGTFGSYLQTMQEKLKATNTLADARAKLITSLYDRPLTPEETSTLPPNVAKAIASGDKRDIDLQIRLLNDQIQGRTNTLDQGVQFLMAEYKDNLDRTEQKKQQAIDNVINFAQVYGDDAKKVMQSLYGDDYVNGLKEYGIDIDSFVSAPTLAQKESARRGSGTGGGSFTDIYSGMSDQDQRVREIILSNPGEWGHAADQIEAEFGKIAAGSTYDKWLNQVYAQGQDPSMLGADLNKLSKDAQALLKNPNLYNTWTPTKRQNASVELSNAGFDTATLGQKQLTSGDIEKVSQSESALANLAALKTKISDNLQYVGPLKGLAKYNPYSKARNIQADIDRVRQQVGKAMEGGVLRKEDEEKYKKILATLNDTPETAIYKIDGLITSIQRDIDNYVTLQGKFGRSTSGYTPNTPTSPEDLRSKYNY